MARKTVVALTASNAVCLHKNENNGSASGYYLGSKSFPGNYEKPSVLHFLQTEEGNLGVWGTGGTSGLNAMLQGVRPGTMIYIDYMGLGKASKKGFKAPHTFKVDFDDELTIDVSSMQLRAESSSEEPNYGASDESEEVSDEDMEAGEEGEVVVATPVVTRTAARTAPVNKPATPISMAATADRAKALLAKAQAARKTV